MRLNKIALLIIFALQSVTAAASNYPQPNRAYTPSTDFDQPAYFWFDSPYRVAEGGESGTGDAGGDLWRAFNAYVIGAPSEAGVSSVLLSMRLITGQATVAVYGRRGDSSSDGILLGVIGAYASSDNGSTYTHLEVPVDEDGDFQIRVESGAHGSYLVHATGYIGKSDQGEAASSGSGGPPPPTTGCPRRTPQGDWVPCQ